MPWQRRSLETHTAQLHRVLVRLGGFFGCFAFSVDVRSETHVLSEPSSNSLRR